MTLAPFKPRPLTEDELIARFREELGDDASIPCDRAQYEDCPKLPAEYGLIITAHKCPRRRRNYCENCFERARKHGIACLSCHTRGVPLEHYWRL